MQRKRRPINSPFHLPRRVKRADYTPSAYEVDDSAHDQGAVYVVRKYGKTGDVLNVYEVAGWRGTVKSQALDAPYLPAYVLAEVERQYSADTLLDELQPAKRTAGRPYVQALHTSADPLQVIGFDWADRFEISDDDGASWREIARDEIESAAPLPLPFQPHGLYRAVSDRIGPDSYSRPPRSVVTVTQSHVSSSGMLRRLNLYASNGSRLTYHAARVIGEPYDDRHETVNVGGCGMDMHFATVYNLASALYGDGYSLTAETRW